MYTSFDDGGDTWREVLAMAVCAGDWSLAGIVRYGAVTPAVAGQVRHRANLAGLLDDKGRIAEMDQLSLVAQLSS